MACRFMNEHRHEFSLVLMCRVLKVARAWIHQWMRQPISERAKEDAGMVKATGHSYFASGCAYGVKQPEEGTHPQMHYKTKDLPWTNSSITSKSSTIELGATVAWPSQPRGLRTHRNVRLELVCRTEGSPVTANRKHV